MQVAQYSQHCNWDDHLSQCMALLHAVCSEAKVVPDAIGLAALMEASHMVQRMIG
jgi:hypothetical protein